MHGSKNIIVAVLILLTYSQVDAQESVKNSEGWNFTIAPYIFFPNLDGQITVKGNQSEIIASPADVFDRLSLAGMLHFEMSNKKWVFFLDGIWMNFDQTNELSITGREVTTDVRDLIVDLAGLRRLNDIFEIGLGVRINSLKVSIYAPEGVVLPGIDVNDRPTWADPLIVARITAPWDESPWHLGVRGDIGGFGAASKITWQLNPSVGYRLSNKFQVWLAYRWIGIKYDKEEDNDLFEYDVSIFGPELGLLWEF